MRTDLTLVSLLVLLAVAVSGAQPASAARRAYPRFEQVQSESHIEQIPDSARIPRGVQLEVPPAQKNAAGATAAAGSAPATCTAANANNQACYTATQQARPLAK